MIGIGPKNPKRVAEKQLNEAILQLLAVCTELEDRQAQKAALEARISRLKGVVEDKVKVEQPVETPVTERAEKKGIRAVGDAR
jgi:hypothetical protein